MKRKEAKKFVAELSTYQFQETSKPGYKVYSKEKNYCRNQTKVATCLF